MLNSVKINGDAAIFKYFTNYSYAFVVRDHEGKLIKEKSSSLQGIVAPEFAEALCIREALIWVKNQDLRHVEIESDCLQIIQAIRSSF